MKKVNITPVTRPGTPPPTPQQPAPASRKPADVPLSEHIISTMSMPFPSASTATEPQKTAGEQDPNLVPVDLPSNFVPYDFKVLHVRPIKGVHQAKFSAAAKRGSLKILIEAVSSLIEGPSALDLTTPDFRWLLYYLRRVNYVRVPLQITVHCSDENHLLKVQNGTLPASTLKNTGTLNRASFKEEAIDMMLVEEARKDPSLAGLTLGYQTMRDTVEIVNMPDEFGDTDEVDMKMWSAELASFLSQVDPEGNRLTLQQRMAIVDDLNPDQINALQKYAIVVNSYGVSEFINMRCMGCGAEIVEPFHFSASMF